MDSFGRLIDICARTLSRYENVVAGRSLLAAVSGGVDSTVLLRALAHLRDEQRLSGPLYCVHVDHAVRADSRENARHVVELCDRLDVQVDVRRLQFDQPRPNEESMRAARYDALLAAAKQFDAGMLLTAHHADDNLETVLFRMLRGTGPRGLAGIPEARWIGHGVHRTLLVRPFLRTRRTTLEAVQQQLDEPVYVDATNFDRSYSRNRLRLETIPQLRKTLGIGLDVALMTVASTARAATEIVEAQGLRVLTQRARHKAGFRLELDLRELDDDAAPFVREALRQAHVTMHAHGDAPTSAWLNRAMALLTMPDGKRVFGRGMLLAERTRDGLLLIATERAGAPPRTHDGGQRLMIDSERQRFGATEWWLQAHTHPVPPLVPSPSEAGPFRALLDPRLTATPWRMRTRRSGDRFQPLGYTESIELRRFLQSRHVPRFDRDRLPLLVDANDCVLWVPGVEIGEQARLRLNTRHCIEVNAGCG